MEGCVNRFFWRLRVRAAPAALLAAGSSVDSAANHIATAVEAFLDDLSAPHLQETHQ